MIIGIGVDVVDVGRFAAHLGRTPKLLDRLFTVAERDNSPRSLAARFAAKEAFFKALGGRADLLWHDIEVVRSDRGQPRLVLTGRVEESARSIGVGRLHLSLSHDGPVACAFVIAEAGVKTGGGVVSDE